MTKVNKRIQGQTDIVAFEQQESYDDNFLPDATELAKYKFSAAVTRQISPVNYHNRR